MIKIKSINVNVEELRAEIKNKIFDIALACRQVEGLLYSITITSGKDGNHMKGSKHYVGHAIDIRSHDMSKPKKCTEEIKKKLGNKYDVILELDHIHIEYDPK